MKEPFSKHLFLLEDEKAACLLAKRLASCLAPSLIITFCGQLGAGKTTLIRAMLRALGITTAIKSPTFSLVESYTAEHMQIHHFDLYRIEDEQELDYIGFRDYFIEHTICCIEWPEKAGRALSTIDLQCHITVNGSAREVSVSSYSDAGYRVLTCLTGEP